MLNNLRIALADIDTADHNLSNPNVNFVALGEQVAPDNGGSMISTVPKYYGPIPANIYSPARPCYNHPNGYDELAITSQCFGGYLYNWCAAMGATTGSCTASAIYPTDLNGNSANESSYDPLNTTSICPAGWRLPTGGPTGEFAWLNAKMNNPSASAPSTSSGTGYYQNFQFSGPFRGVLTGYWGNGFDYQGVNTYLQSSSVGQSSSHFALDLYLSSNGVYPNYSLGRILGLTVRCLLR
jgi:uncharacterized protein (TIGR02145 family)